MLSTYIRDLLYRNERVTIPDFGSIFTKNISAKIDLDHNTFSPPSKKLTFDTSVTENDDLLANYIASVDNMSHDSALNFIKFEVSDWKDKLEKEDLKLDEIGTFSLNPEGEIQFEPDYNANFLMDSFGLGNVEIPDVTRSDSEKITVDDSTTNLHEAPQKPKKKAKKKSKSKGNNWLSFLSYAALFLLLIALGWFFSQIIIENNARYKEAQEGLKTQDEIIRQRLKEAVFEINEPLKEVILKVQSNPAIDSLIPTEVKIDSSKVKMNLTPTQDETKPATTAPTTVEKQNTTTETVVNPVKQNPNQIAENSGRFYIIAGAFKDPGNAINKVKELKSKGYNAIIVSRESDYSQVSYGLYATQAEAEAALKKIKIQDPEAWILGKK